WPKACTGRRRRSPGSQSSESALSSRCSVWSGIPHVVARARPGGYPSVQYGEAVFGMLNDDQPGPRRYQDEVPAVARAVRLLERLAEAGAARSLADLARELGVGPSSLLAILTTLRHAGLVCRDRDGHYAVGPGLAALGQAAACKLRACERFA